ncbi:threonine synthase [Actinomadura macrotermitis]|uniref:Tryptophan synthase beta chain-like PALP domain-containing protein n=1 Tax=Actinomadura macrotermitis TaxID=2585200 RepID=A0A7K0BV05_9ACTN|nr:pyridoxal-phosphate dependent enzyme [Actinomadura macrotermitis]MQY05035.1 hypothetical protein [Actinomadura macrotermitis]
MTALQSPRDQTAGTAPADLACGSCGAVTEWSFTHKCGECGGLLDSRYDLGAVTFPESADPVERYGALLPMREPGRLVPGICVTTPCWRATGLGDRIGVPDLWLKGEFAQPTGSTKDRMAAVVVPMLREFGIERFVTSSTGNSSSAMARALGLYDGVRGDFFCATDFAGRHSHFDHSRAQLHVVEGDFVAAEKAARAYSSAHGLVWEGGFFNWGRREGLKTAYLEAFDQMDRTPDIVVQAVSSGMGMLGAQKGVEEYLALGRLTHQPRLVMVQQETCAPMARGWQSGKKKLGAEDIIAKPSGLATAILRGNGTASYPYLYRLAELSGGEIAMVATEELRRARELLRETEGVDACYASAATIAAIIRGRDAGRIGPEETVLANLTGSQREDA